MTARARTRAGVPAARSGHPGLLVPVVVSVLGVVTGLWFAASPWAGRTVTGAQWLGTFSALSGVLGLVLYAVTIVLSARFALVETLIGGLDKVYRQHHVLGSLAFTLLLMHPALLGWKYSQISVERAARLLRPTSQLPLLAGQVGLYLMIPALVATIYLPIRHQTLVNLQRLLGVLFVPGAYHALFTGGDSHRDVPLRAVLAIICTLALGALVKHSLLGRRLDPHHPYEVASITAVGDDLAEVTLHPTAGAVSFVPGQFVYLRFPDWAVSSEPHPFSIASSPAASHVRIVVNQVGDWTKDIESVEPGARATIEGPYGRFSYRFVTGRSQLWVAGGVGITPFLSMAASLDSANGGYDVDLVWSYPTPQRAPYLDELRDLTDGRAGLRFHPRCDLEVPFLRVADLEALCEASGGTGLRDREVLLCGPAAMRDALVPMLVAAGVAPRRIHDEVFRYA